MVFTFTGTTRHGSSFCKDNFNNRSWYNENHLRYKKLFIPRLNMFVINDSQLISELEIEWKYLIYSRDVQAYNFHASQRFYVSELNIPFAEDDLKSIIVLAHTHLRLSFEEKREEHNLFKPILHITDKELQTAVLQLSELITEY